MKKAKMLFALMIVALSLSISTACSDYPKQPFIEHVVIRGEKVRLEDGIDLSRQSLGRVNIHRSLKSLKRINFSHSYFMDAELQETDFVDCDFSNSYLYNAAFEGTVKGCNFSNAEIAGATLGYGFTSLQLKSTKNYKRKAVRRVSFSDSDFSGIDFSGFNLSESSFFRCNLTNANFCDAVIAKAQFYSLLTIEQLSETKDFKEGYMNSVGFSMSRTPALVNFSKMVFNSCTIRSSEEVKIDLTDSIISGCNFGTFLGLTLENVKSTWNYNHGRMAGIELPEKIQKALDDEAKNALLGISLSHD